jgi:hypothetical protein
MLGKIGRYLLKRIVLIGLPIDLVGAEAFVNRVLLKSPEGPTNIGPGVAVSGISLLVPVLVPRRGEVTLDSGAVATMFSMSNWRKPLGLLWLHSLGSGFIASISPIRPTHRLGGQCPRRR